MQQQNKRPNKIDLYKEKMNERREIEKNFMYNPFGRGGNGAPMRDFNGNVITTRKNNAINNNLYDEPQNILRDDYNLQGNIQNNSNLNINEFPSLANTLPQNNSLILIDEITRRNTLRKESSIFPNNKSSNIAFNPNILNENINEKSKYNSYQNDLLKQIEEKKLQKEMEKRKAAELDRQDEEKYKQFLQLKKDQEEQIKNKKSKIFLN
jgi:hypothetical protein